jgi:hypothetical protein
MDTSQIKDVKDVKPVGHAAKPVSDRPELAWRAQLGAPAQGWPDFTAAMRRVEAEVYDVL